MVEGMPTLKPVAIRCRGQGNQPRVCTRLVCLLALGLFATGPGMAGPTASYEAIEVSDRLTIQRIRENVWIHTSFMELASGYRFPANGLIVDTGDAIVLIDTAWGIEANRELLEWIRQDLGKSVRSVIVTHFHEDSLGGAPVLSEAGIPFFSSKLTRTMARTTGLPRPDSIDGLDVPGSAVQLHGVEVFYPGPGHSADNLVVWLGAEKVLFGSCAVRSPTFSGKGNTADASLDEWPESIRSVKVRYPEARVVVPGHGPPGSIELLDHTIALFDAPHSAED